MTSENWMIVGGEDAPVPQESPRLFLTDDEHEREVELEVQPLDRRFRLSAHEKPILIVGRSPGCDITLPHPAVSYRHAYLQIVGGQVHCIDLASRTGTFWGSEQRQSGWLLPGQSITIGRHTISHASPLAELLPAAHSEINLLTAKGRDCYQVRDVELTFLNSRIGSDGGRSWRLTQAITLLGNSPRCQLCVDHSSVSRVHCSLMVTPDGLWITDLMGKGGTWINGERIAFRLLEQGDEISVGQFRLLVNYLDEPSNSVAQRPHETVDLLPTREQQGTVPSVPPEPTAGYSGEFILSLMDRFAGMQQQMSAVNQQQMMVMAQLVGTMHQNHHDVVQQELARINQIGEQISQLQSQMSPPAARAPQAPEGVAMPVSQADPISLPELPVDSDLPDPVPPELTAQTLESLPESEETATEESESTPVADLADGDAPTSPPGDADVGDEDDSQADGDVVDAGDFVDGDAEARSPTDRNSPRYTPRDVDSHTQLIERMAELERERSSRWKKIMRMVTGSGP